MCIPPASKPIAFHNPLKTSSFRKTADIDQVAGLVQQRAAFLAQVLQMQALAGAQRLHRAVIERPDDPVARFNLALVLSETGSSGRARDIFAELAAREDLPLVRHRAEIELARLRDLQPVD